VRRILRNSISHIMIARILKRYALLSIAACVGAVSCQSQDDASRNWGQSPMVFDTLGASIALVGRRLGFQVESVAVNRGRIDLLVPRPDTLVNPDLELRVFSLLAHSVWSLAEADAETIAVTSANLTSHSEVMTRNTFFYYRSERRRQGDQGGSKSGRH
jgi:hypothetical protein